MNILTLIIAVLFHAPASTETAPLQVPITNTQMCEHTIHTFDIKSVNQNPYTVAPFRTSATPIKSTGSASAGISTNAPTQFTKQNNVVYGSATVPFAAPRQYTCSMCGGDGYINDIGDGGLEYGKWYFYSSGKGDGTSCTNTTGYHDDCDNETYGDVQHHFAKQVCPKCGGTGKVSSSSTSLPSGWTSWTGNAFSHPFSDTDANGHCDEHHWHLPIGDVPVFFFVAILVLLSIVYIMKDENFLHSKTE